MDSYLDLAKRVLTEERQPLSARDIIERAYRRGIVPTQLYGKTQHKTLGARLSEDILRLRERSQFFRTAPGRFFLREFISDTTLPNEFRTPIIAKRRKRELHHGNYLALDIDQIESGARQSRIPSSQVMDKLHHGNYYYVRNLHQRSNKDALIWSFVVVHKHSQILTYRHGRYREDRDTFLKRRSVGFFTLVEQDRDTLFDRGDRGIIRSGLEAVFVDLNIPEVLISPGTENDTEINFFVLFMTDEAPTDLLAVMKFDCPDWFEPVGQRLAINDLRWMDPLTPINYWDDFDPWSQKVLRSLRSNKPG